MVQDLTELPEPQALDFGAALSSDEEVVEDGVDLIERDYAVSLSSYVLAYHFSINILLFLNSTITPVHHSALPHFQYTHLLHAVPSLKTKTTMTKQAKPNRRPRLKQATEHLNTNRNPRYTDLPCLRPDPNLPPNRSTSRVEQGQAHGRCLNPNLGRVGLNYNHSLNLRSVRKELIRALGEAAVRRQIVRMRMRELKSSGDGCTARLEGESGGSGGQEESSNPTFPLHFEGYFLSIFWMLLLFLDVDFWTGRICL